MLCGAIFITLSVYIHGENATTFGQKQWNFCLDWFSAELGPLFFRGKHI